MAPATTEALAPGLDVHGGTPAVLGSTSSHHPTEVLTPAGAGLGRRRRPRWLKP